MKGYRVETFGGDRYTSVGWYARRFDAELHFQRLLDKGAWNGMPPRVVNEEERHPADNAGDFYYNQDLEAHSLYQALEDAKAANAAPRLLRRLERKLESARYVGD